MNKHYSLRQAYDTDASHISELALRSKAYWGYSDEFMRACVDELSYSSADILNTSNVFTVCESGNKPVGFYQLCVVLPGVIELEALFVEPEAIGKGIGKRLLNDAFAKASSLGFAKLSTQADPNAESFYLKAGGTLVGYRKSLSIPNRKLPMIEFDLSKWDHSNTL